MTDRKPADRRPVQPLSQTATTMTTRTADSWRQIWRQYGWIDNEGRMYDLTEPSPRTYAVASYSPLWVLVDNEPTPTAEPASRVQRFLGQLRRLLHCQRSTP